jgi:pyridoxamine 5'-phosphate oxidase
MEPGAMNEEDSTLDARRSTLALAGLRREYALATLDEGDVDPDPIRQFERWFGEAQRSEVREPNAMTLATATADGRPSARIVLLKGVDERGFVFFTDYRSRKSAEIAANPQVALCFHWGELERQVRVVGEIGRVSAAESEAYFRSRPVGSRLGAWTSHQSSVLGAREDLERALARTEQRFANMDIPLPPHWGGFRVLPDEIEFWQGRQSRLHDRVRYVRGRRGWERARLSP